MLNWCSLFGPLSDQFVKYCYLGNDSRKRHQDKSNHRVWFYQVFLIFHKMKAMIYRLKPCLFLLTERQNLLCYHIYMELKMCIPAVKDFDVFNVWRKGCTMEWPSDQNNLIFDELFTVWSVLMLDFGRNFTYLLCTIIVFAAHL